MQNGTLTILERAATIRDHYVPVVKKQLQIVVYRSGFPPSSYRDPTVVNSATQKPLNIHATPFRPW